VAVGVDDRVVDRGADACGIGHGRQNGPVSDGTATFGSDPAADFDLHEIDRLLSTTRAVRRQLDLERPVPRAVVEECLRLAVYAPNATNAQSWRWLVVTDPDLRARVGAVYRDVLLPISTRMRDERPASDDTAGLRHSASVLHLAEHLGEVPVLVVPCVEGRFDPHANLAEITGFFGSIYPAVWSFQLALRSRGLGSVFTNAHLLRAGDIAEVLRIPDDFTQCCLIPVAYTKRRDFPPPPRRPLGDVVRWDRWDG
jgi:nitroreductase